MRSSGVGMLDESSEKVKRRRPIGNVEEVTKEMVDVKMGTYIGRG